MRRLAIFVALAALSTFAGGTLQARDRSAGIYFTQNHSSHALHPAACLGSVTYEVLPSQHGDVLRWTIYNGNGTGAPDDACEKPGTPMDKMQVSLHFNNSPFTTSFGMPVDLTPTMMGSRYVIEATVHPMANQGAYKYVVKYKGLDAGADPDVEVDCTTCG